MNDDEPKHIDVHDSDAAHLDDEWTPEVKILIEGFDRIFLAESRKAAGRAWEGLARGDAPEVAGATAAAVLLAAAACEARLSEYVTKYEGAIGASVVAEIRDEDKALEQWRILLKNRAPTFRCGDSGAYRALGCLFELRNLVAHRNARYFLLGAWPDELKDCVRQKAIPVHRSAEIDWTSGVYVQQVAAWAAETAGDWLGTASELGIVA
jgi:hypothetical protein